MTNYNYLRTDIKPKKAKRKVKSEKVYPNRTAHPELQSLEMDAGFKSVLLKQLELIEEQLRELNTNIKNIKR